MRVKQKSYKPTLKQNMHAFIKTLYEYIEFNSMTECVSHDRIVGNIEMFFNEYDI